MMKLKIFFYLYAFCVQASHAHGPFVEYKLSWGRFGDQLLAYAKAEYIAHTYDIRLLYTPFCHAEYLPLHYAHLPQASYYKNGTLKEVVVDTHTTVNRLDTHKLYTVNLSTKHKDITSLDSIALYALQDYTYADKVKKMITPHKPINKINWPTDTLTVALHVRKPSGHDTPVTSKQLYCIRDYAHLEPSTIKKQDSMPSDKRYPHKFPPDQYYIDQIEMIATLFKDKKLYVYLFTDYHDPAELVERYKPYIKNSAITLTCHTKQDLSRMRFIDDYYNMAQADCLIRASSNFSRAAQLIGNHKVVIYPKSTHWYNDAVIVDNVWILNIDQVTKRYTLCSHATI